MKHFVSSDKSVKEISEHLQLTRRTACDVLDALRCKLWVCPLLFHILLNLFNSVGYNMYKL